MNLQPKIYSVAFLCICAFTASAQMVKQIKNTRSFSMKGAYVMEKQLLDSGRGQEVLNVQQNKIFTDKYVMYANARSQTDSLANFGIGTYTVTGGKVIEKMFFTSSGPVNNTYNLQISKSQNGYSQVISIPGNEPGKVYVLTEEYAKNGAPVATLLNGAWKQFSVVNINPEGKKTANNNPVQFKVFESGNFIWANYEKSEKSGTPVSYFGYGTFEINPQQEIVETNTSSSFPSTLNGKPVKLKIKFIGKDQFEQTINWGDGSRMTETYIRLK